MKCVIKIFTLLCACLCTKLAATEFYFVRHGETDSNTTPHIIGGECPWAELTDEGKEQARALGRFLDVKEFDEVYTSDVIRTQQTARYFLEEQGQKYLKIKRDRRLTERSQGDWDGKIRKEMYTPEVAAKRNWDFNPGSVEKGESNHELADRIFTWMKEKAIEHPDARILVFCHGIAIRCLTAEVIDLPGRNIGQLDYDNTGISVYQSDGESASCTKYNWTPHLES